MFRPALHLLLLLGATGWAIFRPPESQQFSKEEEQRELTQLANSPAKPFAIDYQKHQVTRLDAKGQVVWSVRVDDLYGDVLSDERRVYVSHKDGVTSLDGDNGKPIWHTKGPYGDLLLSKGILLGTGRVSNQDGSRPYFLFACNTGDGSIRFKLQLPKYEHALREVDLVAGLFLVQFDAYFDGKERALLIDRQGVVRHQFDRLIVTGKHYDVVFMTSKDLVRVSATDKVAWTIPLDDHYWPANGGLVELPGGDMIAFWFGCISDSGVGLVRFDPSSGLSKWQHSCQSLGVCHSKYFHTAHLNVEGKTVRVTSKGSFGTFVEVVDLQTGRQTDRKKW
jgi:hypothetical protein